MKRAAILCLAAAFSVTPAAVGQPSDQLAAYEALLAVGRAQGDALLANLVEMRGVDGDPQPRRWTLSFKDDAARGGIREFVVSTRGIDSERAPMSSAAVGAQVMAAPGLKLNSTGAFDAANREAARARIAFASAGYELRNKNGGPVWLVQLYDIGGSEVGRIEFSARDGTVISPLQSPAPPVPAAGTPSSEAAPPANAGDRPLGERWVEGGGLVGHMERWSTRTWEATTNTATRVGDSIGAFFTGRPAQEPGPGH
jgi:hypothetical protein